MLNHLTVTAPKGRHPWTDCTRVDYQLCPKYEDLVATSGRTVPCHHWPIMSFYSSAGLHYFYAPIINVNCTLLFHDVPRWCCGLSVSRAKLVAELFAVRTWSSIKETGAPAPLGSYWWSLGVSCEYYYVVQYGRCERFLGIRVPHPSPSSSPFSFSGFISLLLKYK